jgi:molybdate transport system ATP-binding protein
MAFLEVKNLSVRVGHFLLREISFSLERGQYLAVIGPSGSGKSTLISTLAGFKKPLKGQIFLEGRDITRFPPEHRGVSVVYQDCLLFPYLNVFENIAFGLKKRFPKGEIEKKVNAIAKLFRIGHLLKRDVKNLSGGERQRVAIARALVVEPKLLLMDEPFSALDVETKNFFRSVLKDFVSQRGITVVHITHDLSDPLNMADKTLFMKNGGVIEYGPTERIFNRPRRVETARFLGFNVLKVLKPLAEGLLVEGEIFFKIPPRGASFLAFKPENLKPSREGFEATTEGVFKDLHTQRVFLRRGETRLVSVLPLSTEVKVGERKTWSVEGDKILLLR